MEIEKLREFSTGDIYLALTVQRAAWLDKELGVLKVTPTGDLAWIQTYKTGGKDSYCMDIV